MRSLKKNPGFIKLKKNKISLARRTRLLTTPRPRWSQPWCRPPWRVARTGDIIEKRENDDVDHLDCGDDADNDEDVTDDESQMIVTNVDYLDCGDDEDTDEDVTDDDHNKCWPPWLQRLGGEGGTEQLLGRRQDKADVTYSQEMSKVENDVVQSQHHTKSS